MSDNDSTGKHVRPPWLSVAVGIDPATVKVHSLGPGYNLLVQLGGVELHVSESQWDAIHAAVQKGIEVLS